MVELLGTQELEEEETKGPSSASQESAISSDAWPSSSKKQPKVKSCAHAILLKVIKSGKFNERHMEYKALSEEDQD